MIAKRWHRVLFFVFLFLGINRAEARTFDVIVCGSGGEAIYSDRFVDWGTRLQKVLIDKMGHTASQVFLLTETGENATGVSTVEGIQKVLWDIAGQATDQDVLFVYVIGHGSFRQQVAKVNVPGQDLTVGALDGMLKTIKAGRVVVIQGASVSAPFLNGLRGKGRIVCTSTRSVEEKNATQFMALFVQALEEGSADQNRDERISVLEVCRQAAVLTQAWYDGEGFLATEHALLDDNGDGLGTRLSDIEKTEADGVLASQCFLMDFQVPEGVSPQVVMAYRSALEDVQTLIAQKATMDSVVYYRVLEDKLIHAARLNRQIRREK